MTMPSLEESRPSIEAEASSLVEGPVNEPAVWAACDALSARRESVTQMNVRKELGGRGSYATISPYIRSWRKQAPASRKTDRSEVMAVPPVLQGPMQVLWDQAHRVAEQNFSAKLDDLDKRERAMAARHAEDASEIAAAKQANAALLGRLERVEARLQASEITVRITNERTQAAVSDAVSVIVDKLMLLDGLKALTKRIEDQAGVISGLCKMSEETDARNQARAEALIDEIKLLEDRIEGSGKFYQRAVDAARQANVELQGGLRDIIQSHRATSDAARSQFEVLQSSISQVAKVAQAANDLAERAANNEAGNAAARLGEADRLAVIGLKVEQTASSLDLMRSEMESEFSDLRAALASIDDENEKGEDI